MKASNLAGQSFGRLTVIEQSRSIRTDIGTRARFREQRLNQSPRQKAAAL